MILGLSTATFTLIHVVLSLLGIASGLIVVIGLLTAGRFSFFTALFISTTTLTCLSGFLFPFHGMTLSIEMAIPTLAVLFLAVIDRYTSVFAGIWRHSYVVCVMIALYCSVFVLVAQIFARYLAPNARTPSGYGDLYNLAQFILFAIFAVVTYFALKNFRSRPVQEP